MRVSSGYYCFRPCANHVSSAQEKCNLLTVILRSGESPQLSRAQLQRVAKSSRAHAEYLKQRKNAEDSDSDEGPADESGWLFEDLAILLRMYARLRDREQLIALIFEVSILPVSREM